MHVILKRKASMGVLFGYIHFNHHHQQQQQQQQQQQYKSNPAVCWSVLAPLV
jgi:hypothetical protein